ncbi:hypothetical protein ATCC90586_009268 [Pythium insidiosum]|nr:hypothetical protein ATCC90586_009268 [Pythium insidiosum]
MAMTAAVSLALMRPSALGRRIRLSSRLAEAAVRRSVGAPARQQQQLQYRLLSTSSTDPKDRLTATDDNSEKITAEVIRKKLAADVERAKELALHQVVNVPNVITFARILSTPYIGYLIWDGSYSTAVGVLAVAGFSDWLDGFIARRFKQESIIGSFLDPLADKLMVGTLSLSMLSSGLVPWPLVVLVFGRDALLVSGTMYHRLKTKSANSAFFDTSDTGAFQVEPSMLSKINTALQFSMFGFALTNAAWQIPGSAALDVIFGVVGTTTFLSGSEYLWSYVNKTGAFRPLQQVADKVRAKRDALKR